MRGALLFLTLAASFLLLNRAAWKSYFQHDDFAHLSWCAKGSPLGLAADAIRPAYYPGNYRPLGHLWYNLMSRAAGLRFPAYLAVIQSMHLGVVILLWLLLRELGFAPWPAGAAAVFFALNIACLQIYWQPAYIFDLGCALFCALSLLFWMRGKLVWSLALFFLAYRWKETAIMLPAVLALYEWLHGERRWKQLAPFFALSAWYGAAAMIHAPTGESEYRPDLASASLWHALSFYGTALFSVPWAWIALLAAPFVARDRRLTFGVASFIALLAPMLALSRHLNSTYLYVPLMAAAIALAALADRGGKAAVVVFFLAWMPFNYAALRARRSTALYEASLNRPYIEALQRHAAQAPDTSRFMFEVSPASMPDWGIEGALRYIYRPARIELRRVEPGQPLWPAPAVFLGWNPARSTLTVASFDDALPQRVRMDGSGEIRALGEGWIGPDRGYRWSRSRATALLHQPADASAMMMEIVVADQQQSGVDVDVLLDGEPLGLMHFARGHSAARLPLTKRVDRTAAVELQTRTPNPGGLGVAVVSLGFE